MDLMKHERYFWDQNINYIAGIDEAGRGPYVDLSLLHA